MPLRRFAAYFLAISVCSTIALASGVMGHPAPQDAAASPVDQPSAAKPNPPAAPRGRASHKPLLVASAN